MPNDKDNVAPQGATNNSPSTEVKDNKDSTSITTNIVTGKKADGSEVVELNLKPTKAKQFVWAEPKSTIKEETHKNTKVYDLPSGSKVFPKVADGSKIYYFYNGYYLDLTNFLTFDDLDPANVIQRKDIEQMVSQEVFTKTLDRYVTIDSYRAKFLDYYTQEDVDLMVKRIKDKTDRIPDEVYSKHEVNVLIDNIDTYTIKQMDMKLAEMSATIIKNNNNWYRSLDGLATINFVKDTIKPYVTTAYLENVQQAIANDISETKAKFLDYYTRAEIDSKDRNFIKENELNLMLADYVNKRALQTAIQDLVSNDTLSRSVSNLVSNNQLDQTLNKYVKNSELNILLKTKAEKSEILTLDSKLDGEVSKLETKMLKYITEDILTSKLQTYIEKDDVDNKILDLRRVFDNYETIISSDKKINDLKLELQDSLKKYLTKEEYLTDKETFVTLVNFESNNTELRNLIKEKVTKDYVDGEIEKLRKEYKAAVIKTITEDEVDNKLQSILNTLNGMYNKVEINVIKTQLESSIADLRSYSDNTYVTKKDFNKEIVKKIDSTYVDNKLDTFKTELDLDSKFNGLVTNTTLVTTLNDYPNRTQVNELLKTKVDSKFVTEKIEVSSKEMYNKLDTVKNMVQTNSTDISTLETALNNKIRDITSKQESVNTTISSKIDEVDAKFSDYEKLADNITRVDNIKNALTLKVDNLESTLTPKINANTSEITSIKESLNTKVTQLEIDTAKRETLEKLVETKMVLENSIGTVDSKFSDYLTVDRFTTEKGLFIDRSELSELENTVTTNKTDLEVLINKNKDGINKLELKKLNKEDFEEALKNIYTKTELASKLITFNDVFRKSEINTFVDGLKVLINTNKEKITNVETTVSSRYTNKNIDDLVKEKYDRLDKSMNIVLNRLDDKLESAKYKTDMATLNSNIGNRPTYDELISTINNNNKKFKTANEITTALETFRVNFWNDLTSRYTTTVDMENTLSNYTKLTKLREELDKYATLEKLEEKILEVNGLTRADVISMISENTSVITLAYKKWINDLLQTYVTTQVLTDALNGKVNVSDYTQKIKSIEDNYVKLSDYNSEKEHFVKDTTLNSLLDDKLQTTLSSYYTKNQTDDLLKAIKNLIISNSNLFYSKDIMDDKIALLETKVDASNKKSELDTEIANIKGRFADYPTTIDVESRLNAIQAGKAGISMDSFYNKNAVDTLLLKKLDLDVFNSFKNTVYSNTVMDGLLGNYVKRTNYTTDITNIRDDINNIKTNGILGINPSNVVTTDTLNTTLADYVRMDNLKPSIDLSLKTSLSTYVNETKMKKAFDDFKLELANVENLINYVDRREFNSFRSSVYEKSYVDEIKNKFNDYTTTALMNTKLDEINNKIKTDQEIIALTQSQGGKNYTREKIDELLSAKIDMVTLNNTLQLKDSEYETKYAKKSDLSSGYVTNETFNTSISKYLHLENGGTVKGVTKFIENTTFDNGVTTNDLNLTQGDIRNVRDLTSTGTSYLKDIQSTNISSNVIDVTNNINSKNIILKAEGKLTIPQAKLRTDNNFEDSPLADYGVVGSNLSLIVKEGNPEFVLNIGLRSGNVLTSKMIKFNSDGSLSTRNVKGLDFEDNWNRLALTSELDLLRNTLTSDYVSNTALTTKLSTYQTKTDFSNRLNDFYTRLDVDNKLKVINKNIERLDIKDYVDQQLTKRTLQSDTDGLRELVNRGFDNRFTKDELNKIWKVQLMNDINDNLNKTWVSKSSLSSTLADYVTMATLTPMLTQHGIDIMNNIGSNYVQLIALNERLKNYYTKTDIDSKLALYESKEELKEELKKYTDTEAMNLIHEGMNTQITVANRLASTARNELNTFKDTISTNYYNKEDTSIEIDKIIAKRVETAYTKQSELEEAKTQINSTIDAKKEELESVINTVKLALERKDHEQDELLTQHTNKFLDYETITEHNRSVSDERNISDSKYLTKTEGSLLSKKTYVDTELLKKADLTGANFLGDVQASNFRTTGLGSFNTSNITTLTVSNFNFTTPHLVESTTNIPIENNFKIYGINSARQLGLFLGNRSSKTESEPLGLFLKFNGTDTLTFQGSTKETVGGIDKYKPSEKTYTIAHTEYVDNKVNALKTGDLKNQVNTVSQKVDTVKQELKNEITTKLAEAMGTASGSVEQQVNTVTGKIEAAKTEINQNLEQNYTKLSKLNEEMQKIDTNIGNKVRELEPKFTQLQQTVTQTVTQDLTALEERLKKYVDDKINSEIQAITNILDSIVRNTNGY